MCSDQSLWQRVVDLHTAAVEASETFVRDAAVPVDVVRRALTGSGIEVLAALGIAHRMTVDERIALFPDILRLCMSQKFGGAARDLVLGLPREWVVGNIEAASNPLLRHTDNIGYLLLLGLFEELGHGLAIALARQAASSADYDIRELGEDYLRTHPSPANG
jgi:hypothetical protein